MGAAASLQDGAGSVLARLRGPKEDNDLDLDDDVTNPGGAEGDVDMSNPTKVKRAYRKSQEELRVAKATLSTNTDRVQSLTAKLSEMLGALKVLKTENANLARDFEKAEAELGKMANPEREAYMHKYALGKLHEEFDRYKVEVAEQQHKEAQEMRRLQENLANRAASDDAAKAALRAEVKDLRLSLSRGFASGPQRPQSAVKEDKGGEGKTIKKGGKTPVEVANFQPSSGLQAKTDEGRRAAEVKVVENDGVVDTVTEARTKKREAAARAGREYLEAVGVLPNDVDDEEEALDEEEKVKPTIVECVVDQQVVEEMFGPESAMLARAKDTFEQESSDERSSEAPINVVGEEVEVHRRHVHSFGTHYADAYQTEPYIVRSDMLEALLDFARREKRGLAVVQGDMGSGKSHLLAAAVCSLALGFQGGDVPVICPLFVGASAGSRDTRILLKTLAEALVEALPRHPNQVSGGTAPQRKIEDDLLLLKEQVQALLDEFEGMGRKTVIVLDAVSELFDLYNPTVLQWLPLLLAKSVLIMTLNSQDEVEVIEQHVRVRLMLQAGRLDPERKVSFLTYLVTKHNTAVETELARQKQEMRDKAMRELQRLQEERLQRRLHREKLRGKSKKKEGRTKGIKGDMFSSDTGAGGSKKEGVEGEEGEDDGPVEDEADQGLLGEYEMQVMMDKEDSGLTIYMILAVEFLLSLERQLPALEEATALPGMLSGLVDTMLDLLEDKHGKELVRSTLMILAAARHGLAQAELLQVLLSDEASFVELQSEMDPDHPLMEHVNNPRDWGRFIRDIAPLLRPRTTRDIRGQDLRLRHAVLRDLILKRYITHRCFWHRSSSLSEVHQRIAFHYHRVLDTPMPNPVIHDNPTTFERWSHAEQRWQFVHASQDCAFHKMLAGEWKTVEHLLTSLEYIETKCRCCGPYELLTDYSAALDATHLIPPITPDGQATLSYIQRMRLTDFKNFVKTYQVVFQSHSELVIQQASNMPDASSVASEAARIVGDVEVDVAWFKYMNKTQLGDPCVQTIKCNGPIEAVAYSPDGRRIATGSSDGFVGKVTIWDARNATEVSSYTLPGNLTSICFSGDGKLLLNISNEGTVLITDMISLKERARDIIADTWISSGAITIDGKKMILVSRNGVINMWDLPVEQSGGGQIFNRYVKMFEIQDEDDEGRPSPMTCVAISPNVKRVFIGMSGGLCKVFELSMTEGLSVLHILSGHTSVVCGCSFSADGARVATASLDHTLKVWDVQRGGKPLNSFTDPTEVRSCHFSPDGTFVAVALDSGLAEVLDIASGKTMMSFGRHSGRVNSVMFAPNGKFLISGGMDGLCKVWGIQDMASAETFQGHPDTSITCIGYSADGMELVTGGADGSIKLWGGQRGKELMQFKGHADCVTACRFSPVVGDQKGGVLTASLYDGSYRLWDNLTGVEDEEFRHTSTYLSSIAFPIGGDNVLSGSFDGSAMIWKLQDQKLVIKLGVEIEGTGGWRVERIKDRHEDAITCCAYHPIEERERCITTSCDGTIKVWNTKWGTCVATIKGHSAAVNWACYSKDGNFIYSCSADYTLREWQGHPPFKCQSIIIGHYGVVHQCDFATSGRHLFSVSEDRTLRAWFKTKLSEEPPANAAMSRAGSRPFSQQARASGDGELDWYQWNQVALFAAAFPIRCLAGSLAEENEEVAAGGSNGEVFLLRLMLPGDS